LSYTSGGLALTKSDVAEAFGVSVDFVEDHVWAELRLIYRGRKTFVSIRELENWLERSAARTDGVVALRATRE